MATARRVHNPNDPTGSFPDSEPNSWSQPSPMAPKPAAGPKPLPTKPAIQVQSQQAQTGLQTTARPAQPAQPAVQATAAPAPVARSAETGGNIPQQQVSPVQVAAPRAVQSSLVQTQPITGNEAPVAIQPQRSDGLQSTLAGLTGSLGGVQNAAAGLNAAAGQSANVDQIANPTMQAILSKLANPEARTGEQDQVFSQLKDIVARQVANPSIYDDELMRGSIDIAKNQLGESYDASKADLEADMARRGLSYSSTLGGRLSDLDVSKNRGFQEMLQNILTQKATANAADRTAAFNMAGGLSDRFQSEAESLFGRNATTINQGAQMSNFQQSEASRKFGEQQAGFQGLLSSLGAQSGIANQLAGQESSERDEGRLERGYTDGLRRQARSDSIEEILLGEDLHNNRSEEERSWVQEGQRAGSTAPGQAAAGSAGNMFGGLAEIYADQAEAAGMDTAAYIQALIASGYFSPEGTN